MPYLYDYTGFNSVNDEAKLVSKFIKV